MWIIIIIINFEERKFLNEKIHFTSTFSRRVRAIIIRWQKII